MWVAKVGVPERKLGELGLWGIGPFIRGPGAQLIFEGGGAHPAS